MHSLRNKNNDSPGQSICFRAVFLGIKGRQDGCLHNIAVNKKTALSR